MTKANQKDYVPALYSATPPRLLIGTDDPGGYIAVDREGRVLCKCKVCGKKFKKDKFGKEYANT